MCTIEGAEVSYGPTIAITTYYFPGKDLSRGRVIDFVFKSNSNWNTLTLKSLKLIAVETTPLSGFIDETISHQMASFVEADDQDRTQT